MRMAFGVIRGRSICNVISAAVFNSEKSENLNKIMNELDQMHSSSLMINRIAGSISEHYLAKQGYAIPPSGKSLFPIATILYELGDSLHKMASNDANIVIKYLLENNKSIKESEKNINSLLFKLGTSENVTLDPSLEPIMFNIIKARMEKEIITKAMDDVSAYSHLFKDKAVRIKLLFDIVYPALNTTFSKFTISDAYLNTNETNKIVNVLITVLKMINTIIKQSSAVYTIPEKECNNLIGKCYDIINEITPSIKSIKAANIIKLISRITYIKYFGLLDKRKIILLELNIALSEVIKDMKYMLPPYLFFRIVMALRNLGQLYAEFKEIHMHTDIYNSIITNFKKHYFSALSPEDKIKFYTYTNFLYESKELPKSELKIIVDILEDFNINYISYQTKSTLGYLLSDYIIYNMIKNQYSHMLPKVHKILDLCKNDASLHSLIRRIKNIYK